MKNIFKFLKRNLRGRQRRPEAENRSALNNPQTNIIIEDVDLADGELEAFKVSQQEIVEKMELKNPEVEDNIHSLVLADGEMEEFIDQQQENFNSSEKLLRNENLSERFLNQIERMYERDAELESNKKMNKLLSILEDVASNSDNPKSKFIHTLEVISYRTGEPYCMLDASYGGDRIERFLKPQKHKLNRLLNDVSRAIEINNDSDVIENPDIDSLTSKIDELFINLTRNEIANEVNPSLHVYDVALIVADFAKGQKDSEIANEEQFRIQPGM